MMPIRIIDDGKHRPFCYAIFAAKFCCHSALISASDFSNLFLGYFRFSVFRTARPICGHYTSSFLMAVTIIAQRVAQKQMRGINTSRIITVMTNKFILWVYSCCEEIGYSRTNYRVFSIPKFSISVGINTICPIPTRFRRVFYNSGIESLQMFWGKRMKWDRLFSRHLSSSVTGRYVFRVIVGQAPNGDLFSLATC